MTNTSEKLFRPQTENVVPMETLERFEHKRWVEGATERRSYSKGGSETASLCTDVTQGCVKKVTEQESWLTASRGTPLATFDVNRISMRSNSALLQIQERATKSPPKNRNYFPDMNGAAKKSLLEAQNKENGGLVHLYPGTTQISGSKRKAGSPTEAAQRKRTPMVIPSCPDQVIKEQGLAVNFGREEAAADMAESNIANKSSKEILLTAIKDAPPKIPPLDTERPSAILASTVVQPPATDRDLSAAKSTSFLRPGVVVNSRSICADHTSQAHDSHRLAFEMNTSNVHPFDNAETKEKKFGPDVEANSEVGAVDDEDVSNHSATPQVWPTDDQYASDGEVSRWWQGGHRQSQSTKKPKPERCCRDDDSTSLHRVDGVQRNDNDGASQRSDGDQRCEENREMVDWGSSDLTDDPTKKIYQIVEEQRLERSFGDTLTSYGSIDLAENTRRSNQHPPNAILESDHKKQKREVTEPRSALITSFSGDEINDARVKRRRRFIVGGRFFSDATLARIHAEVLDREKSQAESDYFRGVHAKKPCIDDDSEEMSSDDDDRASMSATEHATQFANWFTTDASHYGMERLDKKIPAKDKAFEENIMAKNCGNDDASRSDVDRTGNSEELSLPRDSPLERQKGFTKQSDGGCSKLFVFQGYAPEQSLKQTTASVPSLKKGQGHASKLDLSLERQQQHGAQRPLPFPEPLCPSVGQEHNGMQKLRLLPCRTVAQSRPSGTQQRHRIQRLRPLSELAPPHSGHVMGQQRKGAPKLRPPPEPAYTRSRPPVGRKLNGTQRIWWSFPEPATPHSRHLVGQNRNKTQSLRPIPEPAGPPCQPSVGKQSGVLSSRTFLEPAASHCRLVAQQRPEFHKKLPVLGPSASQIHSVVGPNQPQDGARADNRLQVCKGTNRGRPQDGGSKAGITARSRPNLDWNGTEFRTIENPIPKLPVLGRTESAFTTARRISGPQPLNVRRRKSSDKNSAVCEVPNHETTTVSISPTLLKSARLEPSVGEVRVECLTPKIYDLAHEGHSLIAEETWKAKCELMKADTTDDFGGANATTSTRMNTIEMCSRQSSSAIAKTGRISMILPLKSCSLPPGKICMVQSSRNHAGILRDCSNIVPAKACTQIIPSDNLTGSRHLQNSRVSVPGAVVPYQQDKFSRTAFSQPTISIDDGSVKSVAQLETGNIIVPRKSWEALKAADVLAKSRFIPKVKPLLTASYIPSRFVDSADCDDPAQLEKPYLSSSWGRIPTGTNAGRVRAKKKQAQHERLCIKVLNRSAKNSVQHKVAGKRTLGQPLCNVLRPIHGGTEMFEDNGALVAVSTSYSAPQSQLKKPIRQRRGPKKLAEREKLKRTDTAKSRCKFKQLAEPSGLLGDFNPGIMQRRLRNSKQVQNFLGALILGVSLITDTKALQPCRDVPLKSQNELAVIKIKDGGEDVRGTLSVPKVPSKAPQLEDSAATESSDSKIEPIGSSSASAVRESTIQVVSDRLQHSDTLHEEKVLHCHQKAELSGEAPACQSELRLNPSHPAGPPGSTASAILKCHAELEKEGDCFSTHEVESEDVKNMSTLSNQDPHRLQPVESVEPDLLPLSETGSSPADAAARWLELLVLDIQGRLSALQRSRVRVRCTLRSLQIHPTSGSADAVNAPASSAGGSMDMDLVGSQQSVCSDATNAQPGCDGFVDEFDKICSLFTNMDDVLGKEAEKLETSLRQIQQMQALTNQQAFSGPSKLHLAQAAASALGIESQTRRLPLTMDLGIAASSASILSTANFVSKARSFR